MNICKNGTESLNPGQTTVTGFDQLLYALGKQLQWKFANELGEQKYVLMIGSIHVEHTAQLMASKFLHGSEWDWALSKANIFIPDRASSALNDQRI